MVSNQYAVLRFDAMPKNKKEGGRIYVFLKKSNIIFLQSRLKMNTFM